MARCCLHSFPGPRSRAQAITPQSRWAIALFGLLGLVVVASTAVTPALARWKPEYANADPAVRTWFTRQHNSKGQWCCDQSDGSRYDAHYTLNPDGSVTLADGHIIASHLVLSGPNPTGHAVWWHLGAQDFCFALGPLG